MAKSTIAYSFYCLVSIWLFLPQISFAQKEQGSIKGQIVTTSAQPATDVSIRLKIAGIQTVTDSHGFFELQQLPPQHDTLVIESQSIRTVSLEVMLHAGKTLDMGTIKVEFLARQLQDIEIRGNAITSYKSGTSFFGTKTETQVKDIPQSIATVTRELIKDKMEFTLKDAINEASGINQYSGYDEYTIRGFRAENARNINGLRGYNTLYTSTMLVNIERIEIIKGPTATLYGNCDPGGTINLVTKKPLEERKTEIDLFYGSWNHFRIQGDVTGALNKKKTCLFRLNAGYDNSNSFRNGFFARSWEMAPSFTYIPNTRFQVNADFSVAHTTTVLDRGQPGIQNGPLRSTPVSLSLTQPGDHLNETDVASNITATYKIGRNLSISSGFLSYLTAQEVAGHGLNDYITPDSASLYYTTWNYRTSVATLTNYISYKFNTGKWKHQLLGGYDFIRSKVSLDQQYYELPGQFGTGSGIAGTFSLNRPQYGGLPVNLYVLSDFQSDATDVDGDVYRTRGIYVQDEIRLKKWIFLLSLREEFYRANSEDSTARRTENVFLPRVGLVFAVRPDVNWYATYNNGFDPFEASTGAQVFDAPFKPITSHLLETGLKGSLLRHRLSASLALYRLRVRNVAVNANDLTNPNLFVQHGEDVSRGIEAEAAGKLLPDLSIVLSYAYCVAKVTKSNTAAEIGTVLENAPRNISGSWIDYMFHKGMLKGFGISAGHSSAGDRNTLDPDVVLPKYLALNGRLHYMHKHFSIAININNITNATYWTGGYNNVNKWAGAPRNCMIGLTYAF